jgi:hypothetical protein
VKIVGYSQEHSRASEHRQRNRKILIEDLDMRKVCAKMVLKDFTEEPKQKRVEICQDLWRGKMTFNKLYPARIQLSENGVQRLAPV